MFAGREIPESANSLLLRLADVTVIAAPLAVKLPFNDILDPTTTWPKLRLTGLAERVPPEPAMPVPERSSTVVPFAPPDVVVKVTLALNAPVPVGAKVSVAEVVSPECRVIGRARLFMAKLAPLSVAWLMLRSLPPLFERITVLFWLDPTARLPKAIAVGFRESVAAAVASAETASEAKVCAFWSTKEIVTDGSPATAAWNLTVKDAACPAASTRGRVTPVTWKPEPTPVIELTVTEAEVLLEIESAMVALLPMATAPKLRLPFAKLTVAAGAEVALPPKPPQPTRSSRPSATTRAVAKRQ